MFRFTAQNNMRWGIITAFFLRIAISMLLATATFADNEKDWYTTDNNGEPIIYLHFFWSVLGPHCLLARRFVERLAKDNPWLLLHS